VFRFALLHTKQVYLRLCGVVPESSFCSLLLGFDRCLLLSLETSIALSLSPRLLTPVLLSILNLSFMCYALPLHLFSFLTTEPPGVDVWMIFSPFTIDISAGGEFALRLCTVVNIYFSFFFESFLCPFFFIFKTTPSSLQSFSANQHRPQFPSSFPPRSDHSRENTTRLFRECDLVWDGKENWEIGRPHFTLLLWIGDFPPLLLIFSFFFPPFTSVGVRICLLHKHHHQRQSLTLYILSH
jgi:hypothetical protein